MERLLGYELDLADVEERIEANFRKVFDYASLPATAELAAV
jgi:hypothetical protein